MSDQTEIINNPAATLQKKFHPDDVEWVIVNAYDYQASGAHVIKAFAQPFIRKEVAEKAADEIFGVGNWENGYEMPDNQGRIKYWIRFRLQPGGEWIYRYEGSSINLDAKGQFKSDAFEIALTFAEKRTWAKIGVGRYLKAISPIQVETSSNWMAGWNKYRIRSRVHYDVQDGRRRGKPINFFWQNPQLPAHALPEGFTYGERPEREQRSSQPVPKKTAPATDEHWKVIMAYYDNMSDAEMAEWSPYLFTETIDEETGEVTAMDRKNLSAEYAKKVINSLMRGFGKLNPQGVPEKLTQANEGDETAEAAESDGVTAQQIQETFDAVPEKK